MTLDIAKIEATQATQDQPTTTPNANYSAIPLVAGKRTVLRFGYVLYGDIGLGTPTVAAFVLRKQSGQFGSQPQVVGSAAHRWTYKIPDTLDPSTTLQVVLPPMPPGRIALSFLVIQYSGSGIIKNIQEVPITLEFHERRLIRVRLVFIRHVQSAFNNLPFDTTPPDIVSFWREAEFAQRMLPLPEPGFVVVGSSEVGYDGSFESIDSRAYDTAWPGYAQNSGTTGHLPGIMDRIVSSEARPPDVVYVGLFRRPAGLQASHVHRGRWIVTQERGFLAHEIGHLHGFPLNANCGDPGQLDPDFPDSDNRFYGYPPGSIGRWGFDTVEMRAFDPRATFDVMSECFPRWISGYTYKKIFQALAPLAADEPGGPMFPVPGRDQFVRVSFLELHGSWVEVELPNLPRRSPSPPFPPAPPCSELSVAVLDREGQILGRFPAKASVAQPGSERWIEADVAHSPDAAVLALTSEGTPLLEIKLADAPQLDVRFPSTAELEAGGGVVEWSVESQCVPLVGVRKSEDAGQTWTTVHLTRETRGSFDLKEVFSKDCAACKIEVVASTGFHYEAAATNPFVVRARPRPLDVLVLLGPEDSGSRDAVELFAIPHAEPGDIYWASDVDGPLGTGRRVRSRLSAGPHVIEGRSSRPFVTPGYLKVEIEAEEEDPPTDSAR